LSTVEYLLVEQTCRHTEMVDAKIIMTHALDVIQTAKAFCVAQLHVFALELVFKCAVNIVSVIYHIIK